jgi:hypothetical protein
MRCTKARYAAVIEGVQGCLAAGEVEVVYAATALAEDSVVWLDVGVCVYTAARVTTPVVGAVRM